MTVLVLSCLCIEMVMCAFVLGECMCVGVGVFVLIPCKDIVLLVHFSMLHVLKVPLKNIQGNQKHAHATKCYFLSISVI